MEFHESQAVGNLRRRQPNVRLFELVSRTVEQVGRLVAGRAVDTEPDRGSGAQQVGDPGDAHAPLVQAAAGPSNLATTIRLIGPVALATVLGTLAALFGGSTGVAEAATA